MDDRIDQLKGISYEIFNSSNEQSGLFTNITMITHKIMILGKTQIGKNNLMLSLFQ
jgi:hypothetical protein